MFEGKGVVEDVIANMFSLVRFAPLQNVYRLNCESFVEINEVLESKSKNYSKQDHDFIMDISLLYDHDLFN